MNTISLCMIVRDEEENLNRCLESIRGIPDEVIIVDTGSRDNTINIASNWTSKVYKLKWTDDFSAARNYSFEQASMDYIFWLDADDVVEAEEAEKLRDLKQSLNSSIDAVTMNYHTLFDENNNVITSVKRLRLMKRSRNFVWHGIVHEDLKAEGPCQILDSEIIISHKKDPNKAFSDRNLKIYENAKSKGKKMSPHDEFHYARELHKHQMYEKAIKSYSRFLANKEITQEQQLYVYDKMASCYYHTGRKDKERELTLKSFELDTPRPEFCCRMGEQFLEKAQFSQAAFWYKLAIEVPMPSSAWINESRPFQTWLPHKQLGLCYFHLGEFGLSLHHNQMVLTFRANDSESLQNVKMLEELLIEASEQQETKK